MKRVPVLVSIILMLLFTLTFTTGATISISNVKITRFSQDVYTWTLSKTCDRSGESISLPAGESVIASYEVRAVRGEPVTDYTVVISADVGGVEEAQVTYGGITYDVPVVDGKINLEIPYIDGVNGCTVKAGGSQVAISKTPIPSGTKESVTATATLKDIFVPVPDGMNLQHAEGFQSERVLDASGTFNYTVTVSNQSSYGETHVIANTATLGYGEEILEESTSFEVVTPEKKPSPKPKPKPQPGLPRTSGGCGVPGLAGALLAAAGLLLRRFKHK